MGLTKLKIFLKFYQILEYKRPARVYPLHNFYEIIGVCMQFQDASAVEIWMELLEGLWN